MDLEKLTIGEVKEISRLAQAMVPCASKIALNSDIECRGKNIVILQRGWVFVGDLEKHGEEFVLKNASVIRNWGTTNGPGEIAINGPTSSTKLDKINETKFHELCVIAMVKCSEEKWLLK